LPRKHAVALPPFPRSVECLFKGLLKRDAAAFLSASSAFKYPFQNKTTAHKNHDTEIKLKNLPMQGVAVYLFKYDLNYRFSALCSY